MEPSLEPFSVTVPEAGHTLAKVLRSRLHTLEPSWAQVRQWIESRRVLVNDTICTDSARRLREGEQVEFRAKSQRLPRTASAEGLVLRHLDEHLVVVEKPAGVNSVRHPSELDWSDERKALVPTLQDLAQAAVLHRLNSGRKSLPPLRIVHRLVRET